MKILWLANIPSPYRVDFFNELGKLCELTVLFEKRSSDERDSSWKTFNTNYFTPVFMRGKSVGVAEAFCPEVIRFLKKHTYDHIIVTNFSDPTGIWAIAYMKLNRIPYCIESDGGFAGTGKGFKEHLKKWLLTGASYYFSTADEHDRYYLTYGAPKEKLIRYPFSSLKATDIAPTPASPEEKQLLRSALGITEKRMVMSVGQFIPRKGFDVLLRAAAKLPKDVGIYIVGGRPGDTYLDLKQQLSLTNVHFVDFMCKENLKKWYRAADLFVLPTREDIWGLVINEAMAQGLPVITTNRCIAGLELLDAEYLVPVDDVDVLAERITRLLSDQCLMEQASQRNHAVIQGYIVEQMAAKHKDILSYSNS